MSTHAMWDASQELDEVERYLERLIMSLPGEIDSPASGTCTGLAGSMPDGGIPAGPNGGMRGRRNNGFQ